MILTSGTKLGLCEIPARLGAGTGEGFRASAIRLDRKIASGLHRSVLGELNYPKLLSISDIGTQGGIHYLVSKFLRGRLSVRFRSGALA